MVLEPRAVFRIIYFGSRIERESENISLPLFNKIKRGYLKMADTSSSDTTLDSINDCLSDVSSELSTEYSVGSQRTIHLPRKKERNFVQKLFSREVSLCCVHFVFFFWLFFYRASVLI